MLLESSSQSSSNPSACSDQPRRIRLRFRKDGLLRLVSHHDLMQCFEMMFRRAQIPFACTQGFHPKPKMAFALSLALGIVGLEEVVEIDLLGDLRPDEILRRLNDHCPEGVKILSATQVDRKKKARVVWVGYQLQIPPNREPELIDRIHELLHQSEHWIERKGPKSKRIDVIPYIRNIAFNDSLLQLELFVSPTGMARPQEILGILGVGDLLDAGEVLVRNYMVLVDETNETNFTELRSGQTRKSASQPEAKTQTRTSLVPGPMSFDS